MNIIIFRTSVNSRKELTYIRPIFNTLFGENNWSFDFDDVDKVLRIVSAIPCATAVRQILSSFGFLCEEMPYSLDEVGFL
ncbi:hypothetical protein [Pedobacter sp. BAL39]|uniref:hypothetical protein n=1 Tax=Pedobacter sp. BAL39 TaxID=391596 RepID=UPI0012F82817|nr:hypothetical protein [Pedobacter sp. BAL39]